MGRNFRPADACRRHLSKGSAAERLASERRARMSWTGPSTCFTARTCCADPCCFTARTRCVQTLTASPRFLKRPSNYSAGLARVNSTSGPSATPQERSIFRPVGWVETFGPLMPAVAIFQKGLPLNGWLLKDVQGCHGQVLALASPHVRAVQTLDASPHACAVCRPLPLHRTRALCADPRQR